MPIFNTKGTVVANIMASDQEMAVRLLTRALQRAGFDVLLDGTDGYTDAFEAEDGTQPSGLPGQSPSGAHKALPFVNPYDDV